MLWLCLQKSHVFFQKFILKVFTDEMVTCLWFAANIARVERKVWGG